MNQPPKGFSPKTLELLRRTQQLRKSCIACGDTGVNSKGEACHPCIVNKGKK